MKKINWTKEMLDELKDTNSITEFARKYGMSYPSASSKRKSLLSDYQHVVIEGKKEVIEIIENETVLEEKLEEVNATTISIIPSIILNIDSLIEKGIKFYLAEVMNNVSTLDKSVSDIEHILEHQYRTLDKDSLATLSRNIGILKKKRRLYKNEYDFLDNNRVNCDSFIKFIKDIRNYSQKICDKRYSTRVLKEELGAVHIINENNSELVYLRDTINKLDKENKQLKNNHTNTDNCYVDRIIRLEKFRIKQERKINREKGNPVWIDKIYGNWKELFEKLDKETKESILKEVYDKYRECNILHDKEIMDYIVWNDMLPNTLFIKGYFLKK